MFLCIDAATPVKDLRSILAIDEINAGTSLAVVESLIKLGTAIISDYSAKFHAPDHSEEDAEDIVQLFEGEKCDLNRRACTMFGTTHVPTELIYSI